MPAYRLFNPSYTDAVQFSSVYDYNTKECLTIHPRQGIGGTNDLLGNYYTSIDYGRKRLIGDIFAFAKANPGSLEITRDGQAVDKDTYDKDFQ